jgi:ABC-type nitrate/sulfonate/bicarbonate transport system ATPase subunit
VPAVRGISLSILRGEFVALQGPSGSGKTTLLNLLGLLDRPDEGKVLVEGRDGVSLTESERSDLRRDRFGFVFQTFNLIPVLSAEENVAYPMVIARVPVEERRERARELLESVGLGDKLGVRPDLLSGGQRQRVAIARALADEPSVLLLDEPFGALDAITREQLQREIAVILAQSPKTVVFITHNMDEAIFFSDRILVMGTRPGRILEEVRVDLPRPREADAVRASREFATMREHLWSLLSEGGKAA